MEYPAGWTCEVVVLRFESYLVDTLPRGEALAVAEHLDACVECAQHLTLVPLSGPRRRAARRGGRRG
jgi:putative zinc finger protein